MAGVWASVKGPKRKSGWVSSSDSGELLEVAPDSRVTGRGKI